MEEIINLAQFPWTGKCAQCGKASTSQWVREGSDGALYATEWCDTHTPDVWVMSERRRKTAEKMRRAAERRRYARTEYSDWILPGFAEDA